MFSISSRDGKTTHGIGLVEESWIRCTQNRQNTQRSALNPSAQLPPMPTPNEQYIWEHRSFLEGTRKEIHAVELKASREIGRLLKTVANAIKMWRKIKS